ncbi:phosphoesterase PA-phosphatase-related protein [Halosimplex carlsbadense 2-9-1]|uniref:Phosphoesterase PA-phosphatase-related protein n=2 Tax=Halosimplex carlsbadense TaxID=171164 RepID=M0CSN6_9EURY|nr:phosphoesterase PA-phosphatase-related protein [Halosimplex carlsbadense 2-9-1]
MTGSVASGRFGETVRAAVPSWLVPVFRGVTRLGNLGVVLVAFAVDYWFVDRERGAHAIGVVVAGTALLVALKHAFAAPRPPASVGVVSAGGHGFPSGHAMGAAIAYGALAVDLDVGSPRARYAAAAVVVSLIALSRVVLGVHFVRDVLAGIAFGLAFLAVAFGLTGRDPGLAFTLAVATGLLAVGVSGAGYDAVALLGLAVGATAAWEIGGSGTARERAPTRPAVVAGLLSPLAGAGALALAADSRSAAVFAFAVAVGAGLVAPPALLDGPGDATATA